MNNNVEYKRLEFDRDEYKIIIYYQENGKDKRIEFWWHNERRKIACVDKNNIFIRVDKETMQMEKRDIKALAMFLLSEAIKEYGKKREEDEKQGILKEFYWEYDNANGIVQYIKDDKYELLLLEDSEK